MRLLESCTEWTFRFRALLFWRRIGASCIYYIYRLPANCYLRANRHFYLVHFHSGSLSPSTTKCCTVSIFQFLLMIINYTNKHWNTNIVMLTMNYVDYEDDSASLSDQLIEPTLQNTPATLRSDLYFLSDADFLPASLHHLSSNTERNSAACSGHNIQILVLYTTSVSHAGYNVEHVGRRTSEVSYQFGFYDGSIQAWASAKCHIKKFDKS